MPASFTGRRPQAVALIAREAARPKVLVYLLLEGSNALGQPEAGPVRQARLDERLHAHLAPARSGRMSAEGLQR